MSWGRQVPADLKQLPQAVIFDVDGTLYSQKKLRFFMVLEMCRALLGSPARAADLKIVWNFRKMREKNRCLAASGDLEEAQYLWGARAAGVPPLRVRQAVQEWIYHRPLPYLARCRYGGVRELFVLLRDKGVRLGIFSDYPAEAKLKALGLEAEVVVAATQADVGRLKPDPKGLRLAARQLSLPLARCLFIGDQDDTDGECARRAGMPGLILAAGNRERQFAALSAWVKTCTG
jgi:HAD superfamily hydrolase (TIGR01549 family)